MLARMVRVEGVAGALLANREGLLIAAGLPASQEMADLDEALPALAHFLAEAHDMGVSTGNCVFTFENCRIVVESVHGFSLVLLLSNAVSVHLATIGTSLSRRRLAQALADFRTEDEAGACISAARPCECGAGGGGWTVSETVPFEQVLRVETVFARFLGRAATDRFRQVLERAGLDCRRFPRARLEWLVDELATCLPDNAGARAFRHEVEEVVIAEAL